MPGGGWRLTRPTKSKQQPRHAQRRRARSRFMPGGGWRLTRPTKLKQQVRHAQRRRALQNTPLLTLRLAGEALYARRTVPDNRRLSPAPARRSTAAARCSCASPVAQRHAEDHQRKITKVAINTVSIVSLQSRRGEYSRPRRPDLEHLNYRGVHYRRPTYRTRSLPAPGDRVDSSRTERYG